MPNHCENDLSVEGEISEIKRFLKFCKGNSDNEKRLLDFNKFIPYPKKLDYNKGGYEWCIENWATKWNAYYIKIGKITDGLVYISFTTAWAPPEPVIEQMGRMFPNLTFELRYFECGMAFHGILRIEKGVVVDRRTADYFGDRGG